MSQKSTEKASYSIEKWVLKMILAVLTDEHETTFNLVLFDPARCILLRHYSTLAKFSKFSPILERGRIVSGHLAQNCQFYVNCKGFNFSPQVRWKYEPVVLGENVLNETTEYWYCLALNYKNIFFHASIVSNMRNARMVK
jgi:hypothetical protein